MHGKESEKYLELPLEKTTKCKITLTGFEGETRNCSEYLSFCFVTTCINIWSFCQLDLSLSLSPPSFFLSLSPPLKVIKRRLEILMKLGFEMNDNFLSNYVMLNWQAKAYNIKCGFPPPPSSDFFLSSSVCMQCLQNVT